MVQENMLAQG